MANNPIKAAILRVSFRRVVVPGKGGHSEAFELLLEPQAAPMGSKTPTMLYLILDRQARELRDLLRL